MFKYFFQLPHFLQKIILSPPKALLLPSYDQMSDQDCSNANVVQKLADQFRSPSHWAQVVHYASLSRVIAMFKQFQNMFCYGSANLCIHDDRERNVKQRLGLVAGQRVVEALELAFPEIMHYGRDGAGTVSHGGGRERVLYLMVGMEWVL